MQLLICQYLLLYTISIILMIIIHQSSVFRFQVIISYDLWWVFLTYYQPYVCALDPTIHEDCDLYYILVVLQFYFSNISFYDTSWYVVRPILPICSIASSHINIHLVWTLEWPRNNNVVDLYKINMLNDMQLSHLHNGVIGTVWSVSFIQNTYNKSTKVSNETQYKKWKVLKKSFI